MDKSSTVAAEIAALIERRLGLAVGDGRAIRTERAFVCAAEALRGTSPADLPLRLAALDDGSGEWRRFVNLLTIGETRFFRDPPWFDSLERDILAPLLEERRRAGYRSVRIWSIGCATGEEPYSIAILLERLLPDRTSWSVDILGTDVDALAIDAARRGIYRPWSFREVPDAVLRRYFADSEHGSAELAPHIRHMVRFATGNLVGKQGQPTPADIVICRNVLMYLTAEAQAVAARRLRSAVAPQGWLLTGSVEARPDLFEPLRPIHLPHLFGFRAGAIEDPVPAPSRARATSPRSTRPARRCRADERPSAPRQEGILARARLAADRGYYEEAGELCRQALARDALDPGGHLLHAQICQELGDRAAARQALQRALFLEPGSPAAHFHLANLHVVDGEREAARRCMRTVVRLIARASAEDGDTRELLDAARAFLGEADGGAAGEP